MPTSFGPRFGPFGLSFRTRERRAERGKDLRKPEETGGTEEELKKLQKARGTKRKMNAAGPCIWPTKLRITDKSSEEYQILAWVTLKKLIRELINEANISNAIFIASDLVRNNIVRGRGPLCRSLLQAQAASPNFSNVYAALITEINLYFPNVGELLVKRCVLQFKNSYRCNDKATCLATSIYIAHLINQGMLGEKVAFQILMLLVDSPTNDSVEIAILFLKECGERLTELSPEGVNVIFDTLTYILHNSLVDKRVQDMIVVMFQVRREKFKDYPAVIEELDYLVKEKEKFVHLVTLDDPLESQDMLNVFTFDPDYLESEKKYQTLSKKFLEDEEYDSEAEFLKTEDEEDGSDTEFFKTDDEEYGSEADNEDNSDSDDDSDLNKNKQKKSEMVMNEEESVYDKLINLRKTIYLTMKSSLDFEDCVHKLLKLQVEPGREIEMCDIFMHCCTYQRTYKKFYALLAEKFCKLSRPYIDSFCELFPRNYFHRMHIMDMNYVRNVAKFFAHLLYSNSIPWTILSILRLKNEDTASPRRIFIKILFQELTELMGLDQMREKFLDPSLEDAFDSIFPHNDPESASSAVNFFTSIGLGGLVQELRTFYLSNGFTMM